MGERRDNPKARMNRLICRESAVPEGWVVVGSHQSPACEGDGANARVIKRPGKREVVMGDSPLPEGYRRVKQVDLEGEAERGWLIERDA
jgi:hypothetical protein